ncbi:MAG TPA: HRDC domain-containing protein [Candidatus Nanoarchaeia archaeon]|nr:HRDC domain-containing protein [Candidatus Nanoarchaeia archaeon]
MVSFTYVDTSTGLLEAAGEWKNVPELAVDLECENNLHHYGAYISLIQISTKHKNWIVDVLKLPEVKPLLEVFEDVKVQKIFHDVSFDFRILEDQFHCHPRNVFDTQIAALFLGKEHLGLGDLLKEYFNTEKESKYQMADWTKRPLNTEMLSYAAKDATHLIPLRDLLKQELQAKGRWSWVEEELAALEEADFTYKTQTFLDVRGVKVFTAEQLGIFRELYLLREQLAKKVNRPVHFVINNNHLKEFALHPPHWDKLRGVHPIVRSQAALFHKAVEQGKKEPFFVPVPEKKRLTPFQKEQLEKLTELQHSLAEKTKLKGHLIMNKEQMLKMVLSGRFDGLHQWQKKLVEESGFKL